MHNLQRFRYETDRDGGALPEVPVILLTFSEEVAAIHHLRIAGMIDFIHLIFYMYVPNNACRQCLTTMLIPLDRRATF